MRSERGQGTVEWVGLVLLVSLAMLAMVAAGVRVPGASLARAVADRLLCAAALADSCGDEPALIAAYGTELGKLVRDHMPALVFEQGSSALPVDFRRCRSSACSDGAGEGLVSRSDEGLPVTAFVHVVDCREGEAERTEAEGADCSGKRAGSLYVQYWTYYADSATLRDVPVAGGKGYTPTTGSRSSSASAPTAKSTNAPPLTTATTTPAATPTGPPTPASSPKSAGAPRPASSSSPAAATPAEPATSPQSPASPPATESTSSP